MRRLELVCHIRVIVLGLLITFTGSVNSRSEFLHNDIVAFVSSKFFNLLLQRPNLLIELKRQHFLALLHLLLHQVMHLLQLKSKFQIDSALKLRQVCLQRQSALPRLRRIVHHDIRLIHLSISIIIDMGVQDTNRACIQVVAGGGRCHRVLLVDRGPLAPRSTVLHLEGLVGRGRNEAEAGILDYQLGGVLVSRLHVVGLDVRVQILGQARRAPLLQPPLVQLPHLEGRHY